MERMKERIRNLIKRCKEPRVWGAAIVVVLAVAICAVFAILLKKPMAKFNPDYEDAKQVYFLHLSLAADSNRRLYEDGTLPSGYVDEDSGLKSYSYAYATVLEVVEDNSRTDPDTENVHVGSQVLLVEITTGEHKGRQIQITNFMSKMFDKHAKVGTSLLVFILTDRSQTDANGDPVLSVSVMNYNRQWILLGLIAVFLIVIAIIGGKVGLRSILGLGFTLACIVFLLVPALLKGFYAIPFTLLLCVFVTIVCFVLLDGLSRKTLAAILGTVAGFSVACLFAMIASKLTHLDGLEYNVSETDTLVQAKFQGTLINLRGLFVSGVIISALGAVMDVAMSISSSVNELKAVNPDLRFKDLLRSGMNIGRDAIGTMTNTLILAFTGGALVNLILIKYFNWDFKAVVSGDYITHEVITGVAGSIGLILAVPLTALIASALYNRAGSQKALPQTDVRSPARKQKKKSR